MRLVARAGWPACTCGTVWIHHASIESLLNDSAKPCRAGCHLPLQVSPRECGTGAMSRNTTRRSTGRTAESAAVAPRLPLGDPPVRPTFARERAAIRRGVFPVAGCDEAGRGPLAGPVVAAAVILDPNHIPRGLNDSKKLTAVEREKLYERIFATSEVGVAFGSRARIDRDNIRRASLWALARAVAALAVRPRLVFVDGIDRIDVICRAGALPCTGRARPHSASPPQLRAGPGRLQRTRGRLLRDRRRYCTRSACALMASGEKEKTAGATCDCPVIGPAR